MKILFFSHDAELYGASRSLVNLIIGLQKLKYSCHVILPYKGKLNTLLDHFNISYSIYEYPQWVRSKNNGKTPWSFYSMYKYFLDLKDNLKLIFKIFHPIFRSNVLKLAKEFDVIVTNTSVIPIGAICSLLIKKPHIWYIREYDLLEFKFGNFIFCKLLQQSSLVVYNSHSVAEYYSKFCDTFKLCSCILYNGLYFKYEFHEKLQLKKQIKIDSDSFIFSIIGYIQNNKGHKIAIDALSDIIYEFPEVKLWIVGGGQTSVLSQYAKERHVENHVVFHGFIEKIESIYLRTDCLLVCSFNEAFGRTTVEAMAYGIPVIGNDHGGTSEIIDHEKTGLLYKDNIQELINCMKRVIKDRSYSKALGENGWRMAIERFNIEKYSNEFANELKNIL